MRKLAKVEAMDSLLPFLYPDEFCREVCQTLKGRAGSKPEARSFVLWSVRDVEEIQRFLFRQLRTAFKNHSETSDDELVENIEWVFESIFGSHCSSDYEFTYYNVMKAVGWDQYGSKNAFGDLIETALLNTPKERVSRRNVLRKALDYYLSH